ncbi:preprotein translocase subunit SecG [Proteiniclasticum sp. C24MP]|uniref:preprotein translocase subunit SecG n=1 Tax=Proteiniclasticum sp. C24MP TaxID=3374101 RepID=UPI0037543B01
METVLIVVEFILAIIMIALVLMQQSKSDGLKGLTGGSSQESFFAKNRGRTGEAFLKKLTVIVAVLFAINTIAMNMI